MTAPLALDDREVRALGDDGWFLRDGLLGLEVARAARAEAEAICRGVRPAGVGRGALLDGETRGDAIAWLDRDGAGPALSRLLARFDALGEALRRDAWLPLARHDVQLARYPGGGARYARHLDAFRDGRANRRVTAILYLNERWRESDGGRLRLHLPRSPVDVAPLLDRLVVFLSDRIEHEVLPTHSPRLAITAWYYA